MDSHYVPSPEASSGRQDACCEMGGKNVQVGVLTQLFGMTICTLAIDWLEGWTIRHPKFLCCKSPKKSCIRISRWQPAPEPPEAFKSKHLLNLLSKIRCGKVILRFRWSDQFQYVPALFPEVFDFMLHTLKFKSTVCTVQVRTVKFV